MRASDLKALGASLGIIAAFAFVPGLMEAFVAATKGHPYLTSFVKFAVLATFGECLGLRVVTGVYNKPGFGVLPRAFVWGVLGMGIKAAFTIFSNGAPAFLAELGLPLSVETLRTGSFGGKLVVAFAISASMNLIFAPVFMTLHKITDRHIGDTGGTLARFFTPIPMVRILRETNWDVMWNFVFKKTIPFFWIPAHTATFLLPSYLQMLVAALLGVALGLILAFASAKAPKKAAA
ncbi:MAG: hypothetical protein DELT_02356 [Desulfovibrio sp.]